MGSWAGIWGGIPGERGGSVTGGYDRRRNDPSVAAEGVATWGVPCSGGGSSLPSPRGGFLCLCGEISAKDSIAFISTVLTFRTTDTDKFSSLRYFRIGLYLRIAYER